MLISAVAYNLVGEAVKSAIGSGAVGLGIGAGALVFFAGDVYISRRDGGDRKDAGGDQAGGNGMAIALGYGVVAAMPASVTAFVQAFAAGALLAMVADTMIPEGYEAAGPRAGILLVLGFALSLALTVLDALSV